GETHGHAPGLRSRIFEPEDSRAEVLVEQFAHRTGFPPRPLPPKDPELDRIREFGLAKRCQEENRPRLRQRSRRGGKVILPIKRNQKPRVGVGDQNRPRSSATSSVPVCRTFLRPKIFLRRAAKSG